MLLRNVCLSSNPLFILAFVYFSGSAGKTKEAKGKPTKAKSTSPDKNKGVASKIRGILYEEHDMGVEWVPDAQVVLKSGYSAPDSKGYRIPLKELIQEGHVEKKSESSKKFLRLTEEGMAYVREHGGDVGGAQATALTNADHHQRLKEKIVKSGKAPEKAVCAIFDCLASDSKPRSVDELLEASGYKRADSKPFAKTIKCLKDMKLIEKDGKAYIMTDKAFPLGRDKP